MNELTTTLTTIASASASFVAILGGFVASKLIAINGERSAVESLLSKTRTEKLHILAERDMRKQMLDEEDSMDFIFEHIDELEAGKDFSCVYDEDEWHPVEYEKLKKLWDKSLFLVRAYLKAANQENCEYNGQGIPKEVASTLLDDAFDIEFCMRYSQHSDYYTPASASNGEWYQRTRAELADYNTRAAILDIQEKNYYEQSLQLKKPKGMLTGLLIFAVFSLVNIVIPIILSSISLSPTQCSNVRVTSIAALGVGLVATFMYLVWMLRWKDE